jgi:hypothetical protein
MFNTNRHSMTELELSSNGVILMTQLIDHYGEKRLCVGVTVHLGQYSLTTLAELVKLGYLEPCYYNPVTYRLSKLGVMFVAALTSIRKIL